MSIDVISFILGGLLITVGLLGGGLEIRELKIPSVGRTTRVLSFFAGVAFVALAPFFEATDKHWRSPNIIETREQQVFPEPKYGDGDLRLDACYEFGKLCGEMPANEWCKMKGFKRAVAYPQENVGNRGIHTRLIGTQAECAGTFCASFSSITCER